ncbi:hypothetical protein KTC96_02125 [Clostridium estertheticum]|uniref:hypothetical protein n=1 Tax=Clostridium estertheticum TaxID=238834 RepID=UPI001C7CBF94|nr:hypothetical protein [Clostridium estertheticum]MBX4259567.1 hypothetical protein [Clostridium estertheticum]WLC70857.1 hypothetical protein KTC96_02125 [Clostridium estertheticum]
MEMKINSNFIGLDAQEVENINGGSNLFQVGLGVVGTGIAVAALVAAPEITLPVTAAYYYGIGVAGNTIYNGIK